MNMTLDLPKTVDDYIEANKRLDLEGMMKHFAKDAVFIDNGKRHEGSDEIRRLLRDEAIAVKAIFEPDTAREEGGNVVLEGPAHGEFPGSPLRFTYRFTMDSDAIKILETTVWA
jgi:ketosteroid isomerase-like protein